jgi:molybdopterin-binding protein
MLRTPRATERTTHEEADVEISARNQLRGRVTAISLGGVMAEVRVRVGDQELVSVITRGSSERLGIKVGDEVVTIIKATEVMLGKP